MNINLIKTYKQKTIMSEVYDYQLIMINMLYKI